MRYGEGLHSDSWAYRGLFLFQDRTQNTKVPIAETAFFPPYSAAKLVQLNSTKQLSRETIGPCSPFAFQFVAAISQPKNSILLWKIMKNCSLLWCKR